MSRGIREPSEGILELGGCVATSVRRCVHGYPHPAAGTGGIESAQSALDESVISLLRESPPERDLHMLITALKIGNDLKEIVELSTGIATRMERCRASVCPLVPFSELAEACASMVAQGVRAFVTGENEAAAATRVAGEAAARLKSAIDERLITEMQKKPEAVSEALELILAARDFEWIAERAIAVVSQRTRYRARRAVPTPARNPIFTPM